MNILPLIGLILGFITLLVLLTFKVELGITIFICSTIIGLFSMEINDYLMVILDTSIDYYTLNLLAITLLIMILTSMYEKTGYINVLGRSLTNILKNDKVLATVIPAILGLLPVAGGALMSAPLIEHAGKRLKLSRDKIAFVNVWYRHVIFTVYPISQLLIMTSILSQVPIIVFVKNLLPLLVIMWVIGYVLALMHSKHHTNKDNDSSFSFNDIKPLLPIIIPIILAVGIRLDIMLSILVGVVILIYLTRPTTLVLLNTLKDKRIYCVLFTVFSAMLMKNVIKESGLSLAISKALTLFNLPDVIYIMGIVIPLGFFMGTPLGTIALAISILSDIVTGNPRTASLVYIVAFLSYLVSPTHLCLILTIKYYKAQTLKVYKYLIPAVAVTLLFALLLYLFMW